MFDYVVYLNDNSTPQNDFVFTNCVNIINRVYDDLRRQYKIPRYVNREKDFEEYLRDNDVEEIYLNDLPRVSKTIIESCDKYPKDLQKRVNKLKTFFNLD